MPGRIATAQTDIDATREQVWAALTEPGQVATWMAGSTVDTTWEVGSPIVWAGEYDGKPFEDRGEVLVFDEPHTISTTHFSPMMGKEDRPENYHTLVWTLAETGAGGTHLELGQDGCDSDEQAEQFSRNWQAMLDGLKSSLEG